MKTSTAGINTKKIAGHDSYTDFATQVFSPVAPNNFYPLPIVAEKSKVFSGQPTASLAHELRNPLTNINLSVGMIESITRNDDLKSYLDIIMRSSVRINDLVTELIKYQHANEVPVEQHAVHQLLEEVLEMAADRIQLKNIVVRKQYEQHDCTIELNGLRMKIALTNIIINAIDAMSSKNGILTLVTKSVYGKFLVEIEDNGCGISEDNIKKIFTPYFTTKPGGLGIGLSNTYTILRSNNVGVKVESSAGKGTRFILFFNKNNQ
ncbi:two-component system sensor histidine kinase NtrB [Chitinophaga nivalis]|uniref:histidine kinase n=1 Tax=Chitinophaga nivalis TaxID=2991709 RepID=A0ABT3IJX0_9BACT|nr:ATP-binding protein [Chitinophaga nivalis]MCW3466065.1 ATP-binding protein [Chitinophaga nivalis]MCW3484244.1 ATP-binding protein [Chitinophaga nivalis]